MRKTLTLPDQIEDAIRQYQMLRMQAQRRDVSFTEAALGMITLGMAAYRELLEDGTFTDQGKEKLLRLWSLLDFNPEIQVEGFNDSAFESELRRRMELEQARLNFNSSN